MPAGKFHKVLFLGAKDTGKTAIIEQAIFGEHLIGSGTPTTFDDIYVASVANDRNIIECLKLFDTAGLDAQRPSIPKHLCSAYDAYVLVFDITRWDTFHCLNALKAEIDKLCARKDPAILILGNKLDLEQEYRQIDTDIIKNWALRERVHHMEVSVTDRKSLMSAFTWLASKLAPAPQRSGLSIKFKKANTQPEAKLSVLATTPSTDLL